MFRCIWCCKDVPKLTEKCVLCGQVGTVVDPYQEHDHLWSRKTINTMECKVCDLEVDNAIYFSGSAPITGKKQKPEDETKTQPEHDVQRGTESVPEGTTARGDSSRKQTRKSKNHKSDT